MAKKLTKDEAQAAKRQLVDLAEQARPVDTRWSPGQSGNPMGRPREPKELDEMLALRATHNGGAKKLADALLGIALNGSGHVQLAAIQYIYDRLEGKPRQVLPDKDEKQDPLVVILQKLVSDDNALSGRSAPPPAALPTGSVNEEQVREARS